MSGLMSPAATLSNICPTRILMALRNGCDCVSEIAPFTFIQNSMMAFRMTRPLCRQFHRHLRHTLTIDYLGLLHADLRVLEIIVD